MLSIEELEKINAWLCYLAIATKEGTVTKIEEQEILNLGCRCLDMVNQLEEC